MLLYVAAATFYAVAFAPCLAYIPYVDFENYESLTSDQLSLLFPVDDITGKKDSLMVETVFQSQVLSEYECGAQIQVCFQCLYHTHADETEETSHKLRAFAIIDSWGKLEAGISQGNLNWLGRPSLCHLTFQMTRNGNESSSFKFLASIIQFRVDAGNSSDPLTARINIGLCLPDACQALHLLRLLSVSQQASSDSSTGGSSGGSTGGSSGGASGGSSGGSSRDSPAPMRAKRSTAPGSTGQLGFSMTPEKVYFQDNGEYNAAFVIALILLAIFLLLIIAGTSIDVWIRWYIQKMNRQVRKERGESGSSQSLESVFSHEGSDSSSISHLPEILANLDVRTWVEVIRCWSLYTNVSVFYIGRRRRRFRCIEGIKVLSLWWIILGHTAIYFVLNDPVVQMDNMRHWYEDMRINILFRWVFHATLAVDTLLVVCGFLMTFILLERLEMREKHLNWKFWIWYFFRRYIRQTIVILILVLMTCGIWNVLGNNSGPQWQPGLNQVENCAANWWTIFLYVQNFFFPHSPCLGWTWFSAVDFQLFLVMAPLIWLSFKKPRIGIIIFCCLVLLSMIVVFVLSAVYDMPPGATAGFMHNRVHKFYKGTWQFFKVIYNKPYTRFVSYGCGIVLGIVLFSYPLSYKNLPQWAAIVCWIAAILLQQVCLYSDSGLFIGQFPGKAGAAFYNGLIPFIWSMTIFWIIWACCQGYGGPINTFLGLYIWKPLSRQAFMVYLINCLVIQFYYTTSDCDFHITTWALFVMFVGNMALSHIIAIVLCFMFDFPFGRIDEMITNYLDKKAIEEQEKDRENDEEGTAKEGESEKPSDYGGGDEGTEGEDEDEPDEGATAAGDTATAPTEGTAPTEEGTAPDDEESGETPSTRRRN